MNIKAPSRSLSVLGMEARLQAERGAAAVPLAGRSNHSSHRQERVEAFCLFVFHHGKTIQSLLNTSVRLKKHMRLGRCILFFFCMTP